VCCSTWQAVRCSMFQCVAVCCSVLHIKTKSPTKPREGNSIVAPATRHYRRVCCSVLQDIVMCCTSRQNLPATKARVRNRIVAPATRHYRRVCCSVMKFALGCGRVLQHAAGRVLQSRKYVSSRNSCGCDETLQTRVLQCVAVRGSVLQSRKYLFSSRHNSRGDDEIFRRVWCSVLQFATVRSDCSTWQCVAVCNSVCKLQYVAVACSAMRHDRLFCYSM